MAIGWLLKEMRVVVVVKEIRVQMLVQVEILVPLLCGDC